MATKKRRGKGTGTIYLHGKTWIARWVIDGKVYKRSTGTRSKEQAIARLDEITAPYTLRSSVEREKAIQARIDGLRSALAELERERNRIPLTEVMERFRRSPRRHECGDDTFAGYCSQWNGFAEWVAEHRPDADSLDRITRELTDAFLADIRDGLSPNAYNKRIVLFRAIWRVLAPEGINPWLDARKRENDTQKRRNLTMEEIIRLIQSTEGETRTLFAIGLFTGLRLEDAVQLRWSEVDFATGYITVCPRKTKTTSRVSVDIPIFDELVGILQSIPRKGSPFVLPDLARRYQTNDATFGHNVLEKVFARAGIAMHEKREGKRARPLAGFHSLRHTFVSLCAERGVPLPVVQGIVGHSTARMTEYYAHTRRETARMELARVFGGQGGKLLD